MTLKETEKKLKSERQEEREKQETKKNRLRKICLI